MERYIECEAACAEVDKGDLLVGNNAEFAKEIINRTPAADVVPREEIQWLEGELEVWKQERFNIFQCTELYEKARTKVVKEIFAEIEQQLRGLFDFFRQDDCIRESSAIMLAISEIAELKKKHTGG